MIPWAVHKSLGPPLPAILLSLREVATSRARGSRMKGPAIFLAQFAGTKPPFDKLETMARCAASLGYVSVQVPTDAKLFDVEQAAKSQTYCEDSAGKLADADIVISELSTHLQGLLVAVHPAYAPQFGAFAPAHLRDKPHAWQE